MVRGGGRTWSPRVVSFRGCFGVTSPSNLWCELGILPALGCLPTIVTTRATKLPSNCLAHGAICPVDKVCASLDVSGLPCPDMSTAGLQQKRAGVTSNVYIAHGAYCTKNRTPLLLIECTPDSCSGFGCLVEVVLSFVCCPTDRLLLIPVVTLCD